MRKIEILRLDHREFRDQRITSHVALSSRAFGATSFVYSGEKDINLEESMRDVSGRWGGKYTIDYTTKVRSHIKAWKGIIIHLTMYGEEHKKTIKTLQTLEEDLLIIVGGSKVPGYVYELSDFNTAIGWQPHSEIAAISFFLGELLGDQYLYKKYDNASIAIDPAGHKAERSDRFKNTP